MYTNIEENYSVEMAVDPCRGPATVIPLEKKVTLSGLFTAASYCLTDNSLPNISIFPRKIK